VPLPAGSGDAELAAALDEQVLPALAAFAPEALLVSAGFDAWQDDPLGGLRVSLGAYEEWGVRLGGFARRHCAGRLLAVLEGGYDIASLGRLAASFLAGVERGCGAAD
jgi:acetoin utilization deacetylase AcuC-like enzyme